MKRDTGVAIVAGGLAGLGLHGTGMYLMRKYLSPEFTTQPLWHETFSAATMVMAFAGLMVLAALLVFSPDDGKSHPTRTFLGATAVWLVLLAIFPPLF